MKRSFPILLAVLALAFSSLACEALGTRMSIENLRMAYDEAGAEITSTYSPTDVFYAVGDLKNAPEGTVVRAVWGAVYIPDLEEDVEFPEQTLDITEESYTGTIYFQLSNDLLWPEGLYRVDVYLDDILVQSMEFSVE